MHTEDGLTLNQSANWRDGVRMLMRGVSRDVRDVGQTQEQSFRSPQRNQTGLRLWHSINEVGLLRPSSAVIIHLLLHHHHHHPLTSPSNQPFAWRSSQQRPMTDGLGSAAKASTAKAEYLTRQLLKQRFRRTQRSRRSDKKGIFLRSCCGRSRIED